MARKDKHISSYIIIVLFVRIVGRKMGIVDAREVSAINYISE